MGRDFLVLLRFLVNYWIYGDVMRTVSANVVKVISGDDKSRFEVKNIINSDNNYAVVTTTDGYTFIVKDLRFGLKGKVILGSGNNKPSIFRRAKWWVIDCLFFKGGLK